MKVSEEQFEPVVRRMLDQKPEKRENFRAGEKKKAATGKGFTVLHLLRNSVQKSAREICTVYSP